MAIKSLYVHQKRVHLEDIRADDVNKGHIGPLKHYVILTELNKINAIVLRLAEPSCCHDYNLSY